MLTQKFSILLCGNKSSPFFL